jgi:hypothetical protein
MNKKTKKNIKFIIGIIISLITIYVGYKSCQETKRSNELTIYYNRPVLDLFDIVVMNYKCEVNPNTFSHFYPKEFAIDSTLETNLNKYKIEDSFIIVKEGLHVYLKLKLKYINIGDDMAKDINILIVTSNIINTNNIIEEVLNDTLKYLEVNIDNNIKIIKINKKDTNDIIVQWTPIHINKSSMYHIITFYEDNYKNIYYNYKWIEYESGKLKLIAMPYYQINVDSTYLILKDFYYIFSGLKNDLIKIKSTEKNLDNRLNEKLEKKYKKIFNL